MDSIAKETDESEEESKSIAKMNPAYNSTPSAMAVKPSNASTENAQTKEEVKPEEKLAQNTADTKQEAEVNSQTAKEMKQARPETAQKMTITEALSKDPDSKEKIDVGSESIEYVGRDRRIKRVKPTTATTNLKSAKPSGKLIITDDYHRSPSELLGITAKRKYGATTPQDSKWLFSGSKFNCELRHPIPGFGYAVMKQGIQEPLQFMVESDGFSGGSGQARVQSKPPIWQRYVHSKDLGVVDVIPKDRVLFTLTNEWVKRLMLELKDGMVPTISFWDEDTGGENVVLTVSSFNFEKHLPDFSRCLGELLPYSFKDVKQRTVYFGYDKYKLTEAQRARLDKLIEYVKLDEEVKKIDITGFSDSVGFARYNRTLAKRRAEAVKKYMLSRGLPAKKLVVNAKGEKGKKHSNRTEDGRRKNRRVEVTLRK